MSEASEVVVALFRSGPYLIRLMLSLGWLYTTLGWRVRSTRHAFEEELLRQGMSKEDAERLSAAFQELKDDLVGALRGGVFSGFSVRF
jgi:hypothetical protein